MANEFPRGNTIRLEVHIYDKDGALTDASTVTFLVTPDYGTSYTKSYPADPEVVRDSVGYYYMPYTLDYDDWYCWICTATSIGVDQVTAKLPKRHFKAIPSSI
jgi:hypothetical protein